MQRYVLKETSVWGDAYRATTAEEVLRCGGKQELLHTFYRFLDHSTLYALKPAGQRGPARESQTCIVSYVYVYDQEREQEFLEKLATLRLRFHKEPCLFRGKEAYRILLMDTEVDSQILLNLLPPPN
jgi:hypothetical protein